MYGYFGIKLVMGLVFGLANREKRILLAICFKIYT